ncbi:hypothetical protein KSS87_022864 [Heliosperma pusillum]|nr:hypothetical protein KSS87_022864 [Heliosperma pusillum]
MESNRLPFSLSILSLLLIVQVVLIGFTIGQDAPASNDTTRARHAPGVCAMYDICGARSDGKILNCPLNTPAVKVIPFLVGCPACLRNFLNIFCEMSCSPDQSLFIDVTSIKKVNNNLTVDGIEFYVTDAFGEGLYDSCKEVKFGTMNTRAIEFVAGGAKDFKGWFTFIGRQVGLNVPGSPYLINFTSTVPASSGMRPMNVSAYSCSDTSLGCSCGDCPSSPACSSSAPPPVTKSNICLVKLGSVKARCSDIAVSVVFVVMVFMICGWGFLHQKSKTSPDSRTKPLTNTAGSDKMHSSDPKDGDLPLPILFDQARLSGEAKLSVVQGYMSNFYRKYGVWAARRPALVLFSSVAVVLVLCVGLIRFQVETRPEKVPLCAVLILKLFCSFPPMIPILSEAAFAQIEEPLQASAT